MDCYYGSLCSYLDMEHGMNSVQHVQEKGITALGNADASCRDQNVLKAFRQVEEHHLNEGDKIKAITKGRAESAENFYNP